MSEAIAEQQMTSELAIPQDLQVAKYVTDDLFNEIASSSKFLSRLQLNGGTSDLAKKGLAPIGTWVVVSGKEQFVDVGKEIRVYVLAMRLKALDMQASPIVAFFNPATEQFKTLYRRSNVEKKGPMVGPEFLLYLPDTKEFITFHMASKTNRREAPHMKAFLGKKATLKIKLIENDKGEIWHGPVVVVCDLPIALPPREKMLGQLEVFNNPPESETDTPDEKETAATTRER
jgi:hypothetical protein